MEVCLSLYSDTVILLVSIEFAGYLGCYFLKHRPCDRLLAILFAFYLLSELCRGVFTLDAVGGHQFLSTEYIISVALKFALNTLYFLVIYEQLKQPIRLFDVFWLGVGSVLCLLLALYEATQYTYFQYFVYMCLWGTYRLFPVRTRDPRTHGMFYVVCSVCVLQITCLLLSWILPAIWSSLFHRNHPFDLFIFAELIQFIVLFSAAIDLLSILRMFLADKAAKNSNLDLKGILQLIRIEYHLTERECELLSLLIQGKTNREIAEQLYISEGTTKVHLHNIYQKLGISGRAQVNGLVLQKLAFSQTS